MDNNKYNLMLLITSIAGAGAEYVVSALCRYLDKNKFNVYCCYLKERGERGDELYYEGYDVFGLPGQNSNKPNYLSFIKLRHVISDKNIHILHTHDLQSLVDSSLVKLITPNLKLVHTFHFGNYPHREKKYLFLEKVFSKFPNKLVSVGHKQKKAIVKTFKLKEKDIITVLNGVPRFNEEVEQDKCNQCEASIVIGSISTFIEQKGLKYFINAIERLKIDGFRNFSVMLVGDGPLRNDMELICKEKGLLNCITFTGWVPNARQNILPKFDIFVQSSLWEAFSIVILEAMAAGKPIITTNVGDNGMIIEHEKSGLIVEPGDSVSLCKEIIRLVCEPDFRKFLGRNAKEEYNNKYTADVMISNYEILYSKLLKDTPR